MYLLEKKNNNKNWWVEPSTNLSSDAPRQSSPYPAIPVALHG